ncbi:NAD-dependent epimerase/dehydratase family protein [Sulfurimonas indica]|uniref:NAD-dependent epimerase/dehydratase family protein n=1 Tax=Sulfurimonas indica TaxID=2508707 RepID=UPI00126474C6|nr:NAD-dependent epimerase/dehydratase family protein [Sulfurimonas indica]
MRNTLTLIIGKNSNLSINLNKNLHDSILISTLNITDSLNSIELKKHPNINIIFNQFQKSTKLYTLDDPIDYIQRSIVSTSKVLSYIIENNLKINKIIYTSSSSVYGNNTNCHEYDNLSPQSLHASLKLANEKLIEKFSQENNINYTITRVFNMYGDNDSFSIVNKIIKSYNNHSLTLINNGEAIRDFIHINDVVIIYKKLLEKNNIPIINIGTGIGKSVLFILDFLRKHNINIKTSSITKDELKVSISNNQLLLDHINDYKFIEVEKYILKKLKDKTV